MIKGQKTLRSLSSGLDEWFPPGRMSEYQNTIHYIGPKDMIVITMSFLVNTVLRI